MGLGPQRKDSKTFGTTVYGLTHPSVPTLVGTKYIIYKCMVTHIFIKRAVMCVND